MVDDHPHSPLVAGASFLVPSTGQIFLKSRGLAAGKVEVLNSGLRGDQARIYVTVHYPSHRRFKLERQAVVCTLQSGIPGEYGIGIYVSLIHILCVKFLN
jgi:hypothetical protein